MRRKVRRYILIPAVPAIAALLAIIWLVGAGAAERPPEQLLSCGTCHSMDRQVQTWLEGPHSTLACLQCHDDNDPEWVRHEFTERNAEMAGHAATPGLRTLPLKVLDERCQECHQPQMDLLLQDITPPPLENGSGSGAGQPMATRAEHRLHLEGQPALQCVDCHVVHGPRSDTPAYRDDTHRLCQDCHDAQQVAIAVTGSASCAACHRDPAAVAPDDHRNRQRWQREHGQASQADSCGQCHVAASAGPHGPLARPAAFPAGDADACLTCHGNVSMPHPPDYLARHGQQAQAAAPGTCAACHSPQNPVTPAPAHADAGFCTGCHLQPMPHPDDFAANHGAEALRAPATCAACHSGQSPANPAAPHASAAFCAACHDAYRHPSGWMGTHGQASLSAAPGACAACHSPGQHRTGPAPAHASARFCTDCHQGVTMPHQAGYLSDHGQAHLGARPGTCETCHSPQSPVRPAPAHAAAGYCTDCHAQPMPHSSGWPATHGQAARQAPGTCQACHSPQNAVNPQASHASADFCTSCHDAYRHPAGWVAAHGAETRDNCATCHTLAGRDGQLRPCAACHDPSGRWHPQMWFVSHGKAVEEQGEAGCMECHAEVKPSCSECHRRR